MKIRNLLVVLSFLHLLISCNSGENPKNTINESTEENKIDSDGTAQMINLLKEAAAEIDPMRISYFRNAYRAEQYGQHLQKATDFKTQLKGYEYYSNELLKAGDSERAVMMIEQLFGQLEHLKFEDKQILYQINKLRALAYMRLGEQNNCLNRFNASRCIMPFEKDGVYEMQTSVRTAISIYEKLLAEKPDDFESMWMLNFAYMALGEYPEKVPPRWRLNPKEFRSDYEIPRFPNIAHKLGINTVGLSGGTCVDDFNNDGFLDIFASSWGFDDQIRLFINNGDGTFIETTQSSGLLGLTGGLNMNHCDYNNDGFLDVFVLRGAWFDAYGTIPNSLIRNNGDGTFTDVTVEAGLLSHYPTQTAAWADFNNDGWLDVFIGNESLRENNPYPCELYINNGNGTFTNKIEASGLLPLKAMTKGVTAGDVDNDGYPDLYISYLNASNRLLINNGANPEGIVSFRDAPSKSQVIEPISSFPCWMWDYDNDGWQDIFVASFNLNYAESNSSVVAATAAMNYRGQLAGGEPRLYRNNGDGTFTEKSKAMNLTEGMFAMGSNYGDIDNDGWLDFYLGTGEPSYTAVVPNKMFRNNAGKTFQDVTTAGGLGHVQKGHAVGFGDFDNDGDQDIFSVMGGAYEGDVFGDALFLNPMGTENNWVTLVLEGTISNRSAIGARVKIEAATIDGEELVFHRTVNTGGSFGGNSLQLETGLGKAAIVNSITVQWPNAQRTVETFRNIEVNRVLKLKEGSGRVEYLERRQFQFPG